MAPQLIRRYANRKYGRVLTYYIERGSSYREDRITKFMEFPSDNPDSISNPKIELPSNWINRYHQYSHGFRPKDEQGKSLGFPSDVDGEELGAFKLLHMDSEIYLSDSDSESGGVPTEPGHGGVSDTPEIVPYELPNMDNAYQYAGLFAISAHSHAKEVPQDIAGLGTGLEELVDRIESIDSGSGISSGGSRGASEIEDASSTGSPVEFHDVEDRTLVPYTPPQPSYLLALPTNVRHSILLEVLKPYMLNQGLLAVNDIEKVPAVLRTCRTLRTDIQNLWHGLSLVIPTPLRRDVYNVYFARHIAIRAVFSGTIPKLALVANVIEQVSGDTQTDFLQDMSSTPGVHTGSKVLCLDKRVDGVNAMRIYTAYELVRKTAMSPANGQGGPKYGISFAPTNHSGIFGWMLWADLQVSELTIHVNGTNLWDHRVFGHLHAYRYLPITALIASVIASKPNRCIGSITLTGLNQFCLPFQRMWESIPERTPITGRNPLLDQLVDYPFADGLTDIHEMTLGSNGLIKSSPRSHNMFGLRTRTQWQAMIMMARHGKNEPRWGFFA